MIKIFLFIIVLLSNISFATSKEEIANKIAEILAGMPPNTSSGILIYNPLTRKQSLNLMNKKRLTQHQ